MLRKAFHAAIAYGRGYSGLKRRCDDVGRDDLALSDVEYASSSNSANARGAAYAFSCVQQHWIERMNAVHRSIIDRTVFVGPIRF